MEDGIYTMRLAEVSAATGDKGPYWIWKFQVPEDTEEEHAKRYKKWNQWLNTSLSEASAWRLKDVFAAFGVSTDTDTDELIGARVRVQIGSGVIGKGKRAGEPKNEVEKVLPLDPAGAGAGKGSGSKGDKPLF